MRASPVLPLAFALFACSAPSVNFVPTPDLVGTAPVDFAGASGDGATSPRDGAAGPEDLTVGPDLTKGCAMPCMAPTPDCDPQTGTCVPCLPGRDNCSAGNYCAAQNGSYACVPGCKITAECPGAKPGCCNHTCVDLASDAKSCGMCGAACVGVKLCCDAACTDVTSDAKHCGGCGMACGMPPNAKVSCQQSACKLTGCTMPFADCNNDPADGCEANLSNDAANCTGCGNACDAPNGISECNNGCKLKGCYAGFADCNNNPVDGCEAAITKDPVNCGKCGQVCPAPPNASAACNGGVCSVGACKMGFGDCDNNIQNGCEAPLDADLKNCGACGQACMIANGAGQCQGGMCGIAACMMPFADCNNLPADGCETDRSQNPLHCGACGKVCPAVANGTPGCKASVCGVGTCNMGYDNCDANAVNGCEINLLNDAKNCGVCGKVCPMNKPTCGNGTCTAALSYGPLHTFTGLTTDHYITQGSCSVNGAQNNAVDADYFCKHFYGANCTVRPVYIKHTTPNATYTKMHKNGGCTGNGDNIPNTTCDAGPCKIGNWSEITSGLANLICDCVTLACNQPLADCNMNPNDACEINTATDLLHCGGCGKACPAIANGVASCVNGVCGIASCNANFANCDANLANGCEASLLSDKNNCAKCGTVCPQNQTCTNGKCAVGVTWGPMHTFVGLTTDHYITQGGCSAGGGNMAIDADYFCKHFYGATCLIQPGYVKHTTPNLTYPKMHKFGGCTGNGSNIPNTTCDGGPCKIGNWSENTTGVGNLICFCP
ncbi:MAG: hypothetical protein EXR72_04390 [Myxococcales bacterium]|nr:hypothetical protein [Myxococcales bacterium]